MAKSTKSYEERMLEMEKKEQESLEKAKRYATQKKELLNDLNQCCDNENENDGFQVIDTKGLKNKLVNQACNDGSDGDNEDNRTAHTCCCFNFFRYTDEGADTEELAQYDVADQRRAYGNNK